VRDQFMGHECGGCVSSFYGKKTAWNLVCLKPVVLVYRDPKTATKPTHTVGISALSFTWIKKLPVFGFK